MPPFEPFILALKKLTFTWIYTAGRRRRSCQDYSECDCADETACGWWWWAYDHQVTDSAVSSARHERARRFQSCLLSLFLSLPRRKPDIQHGAVRQSSRGANGIWAFPDENVFFSSTHWRRGNKSTHIGLRPLMCAVQLCVRRGKKGFKKMIKTDTDINKEPEHMYVGVFLSISCLAWLGSIATGCTV